MHEQVERATVHCRPMKKVLGALILLLSLVLLSIGCYGLWLTSKTSQPALLTLDDYIKERPAARWVRLTSCKLNLLEASYTQNTDGSIKDMYVPVYSNNDPNPYKVDILLHVNDINTVKLLDAMHDLKDEAEILNYLALYRERIFPRRDVEGVIRFSGEFPEDQRAILKKVSADLAPNFVVLNENELPERGPTGVFLISGVLLALLSLPLLRSRAKPKQKL